MFTVKASVNETFEFPVELQKVKDFFAEIANFGELMPGVKSIHVDGKGVARLTIEAEIPVVGTMTQTFAVELTDDSEDHIEWTPARGETQNLLRYTADFLETKSGTTQVQFSQTAELRREKGRDLHFLAGMAGESIISTEMTKRFAEMVKAFIGKARGVLIK